MTKKKTKAVSLAALSALCASIAVGAICVGAVKATAEESFTQGFFQANDAMLNTNREGIVISVSPDADNKIEFKNEISDGFVGLSFQPCGEEKTRFKAEVFTLTDAADATKKVMISFSRSVRNADYTVVRINSDTECKVDAVFHSELSNFSFSYDRNSFKFVSYTGVSLGKIAKYADGSEFKGFPSGKVKLSVSFTGVTAASELLLLDVAHQKLGSYVVKDNAGPLLRVDGGLASLTYESLGNRFTVPAFEAYDVFSGVKSTEVKVFCGDETVYTGDGKSSHELTFERKGRYEVIYSATDGLDNFTMMSYVISVLDTAAPKISIDKSRDSAIARKDYAVRKATVECANEYELFVYVIDQNGGRDAVDGDKYEFKKPGKYTVCYYVVDEFDNIARETYTVEVK